MIKYIIFFTFFAISLFFIGTYVQKFKANSETVTQAKLEQQKAKKVQEELIQIGEVSDGAKLYNEELRKGCEMSGYSLARKKTKEQWEEIAKNGKFAETIQSICSKVKFNNIWTPDIYEYLYKNAISSTSYQVRY